MKSLIQYYFRHRKFFFSIVCFLIVLGIFYFPDSTFAQADFDTNTLLKSINEIVNIIIRFAAALLWPVLLMIGSLLDNDLIFGGAMGERLLGIWVQIRNLVNIVFVVVLIAIALYNVMGLGEEGGALPLAFKTIMPKFVIALIAVNFSFLAAKVVLDFTNVVTGAVFALPATAVQQGYELDKSVESIICGVSSEEASMKPLWCNGEKLNERAANFFSRLDRSNITLAYAIRFARTPQLKFIKDGLKDLGQLGFNIIFNAVLYVVYALSFIALFLVLLFRVVALWIGVVLSPLLALTIVLPDLGKLAGGGGELKDHFVKNAIAPIKIGLVLSIGYIMLDGFEADKTIHGAILSSSTLSAIDPNALPTDISDLQQLMIAVGVIVIVWVGVFSAAEESAAKGLTGFMRDQAQSFGKWVAKLPTYLQVIPMSGKGKEIFGERAGLAEIGGLVSGIKGGIEERFGGMRAREYGRQLLGLPVINEMQRSAWRGASDGDAEKIAQAIAKHANILQTPEGWGYFQQAMMKHDNLADANQFKKKYGEGPSDVNKAAEALSQHPTLKERIRTESAGHLDSAPKILEAMRRPLGEGIKAEGVKPLNDKASVIAALADTTRTPESLARKEALKEFTAADIEVLKNLHKELREAVIIMNSHGTQVDKTATNTKMQAARNLQDNLNASANSALLSQNLNTAITTALQQGVSQKAIETAIDAILKQDALKKAAKDLLTPHVS